MVVAFPAEQAATAPLRLSVPVAAADSILQEQHHRTQDAVLHKADRDSDRAEPAGTQVIAAIMVVVALEAAVQATPAAHATHRAAVAAIAAEAVTAAMVPAAAAVHTTAALTSQILPEPGAATDR